MTVFFYNFFTIISCNIIIKCIALFSYYLVKEFFVKPKLGLLVPVMETISLCLYFILTDYAYPLNISYSLITIMLSISIFTDIYALLISTIFSSYLIPFIWIAAYYNMLFISLTESVSSTFLAIILFFSIRFFSTHLMGKEAMGRGDIDLFSFIASCVGFYGAWFALTIGSCLGSLYGIICITSGMNKKTLQLPFGSFLGLGAIAYLIWQSSLPLFIKSLI